MSTDRGHRPPCLVVYSDMVSANTTAVSAGGEEISFQIEGNNTFVISGNGTARAQLLRTDIPCKSTPACQRASYFLGTSA